MSESTSTFSRKRLSRHIFISFASLIASGIIYVVLLAFYPDPQRWIFRLSLTTAYVSVVLLAVTLTFGTWNVFRQRSNPVSSDLRRDVGIWCGIFSLVHVLFGFNVHLQNWTQYFVDNSGKLLADLFGTANYLGVLAVTTVILLLVTSNNFSLRLLGRNRWKAFQRGNYVFAVLTLLHGYAYQTVEKRFVPFGFIFSVVVLWMAIIQMTGFVIRRRQISRLPGISKS